MIHWLIKDLMEKKLDKYRIEISERASAVKDAQGCHFFEGFSKNFQKSKKHMGFGCTNCGLTLHFKSSENLYIENEQKL